MSRSTPRNIRNIAVVAHCGAGKTTLIESLLFEAKAIQAKGAVDKGKAVMLTEPEESARHVAITVHVGHLSWQDTALYFVDTPGDFNFLESTRGVLPAVDGVVFVFTGTEGVRPETERLWNMVQTAGIPTLGFVNQMDDPAADLAHAISVIERALGRPIEPITYPLRQGGKIIGIIDLLHEKAVTTVGGKTHETAIPDSMREELQRARAHLVERIVENDDRLLDQYLGGVELPVADLLSSMKQAVIKRDFVPVLCGSGNLDIGMSPLLDYIVACLPSPEERDSNRPVIGHGVQTDSPEKTRHCSSEAPFAAQVFKTTIDPFFGKLSIIRVFSGQVSSNEQILNSNRNLRQRTGHLYILQGKDIQQVESLSAGEIGAIAKLEDTHTGETICSTEDPIRFPIVEFASPPVAYAVQVDAKNDEKVSLALMKLADEDPSLHFYRDENTHQMILAGMGQTHIDVTMERLERKFGAHANLKIPAVPYRETIRKTVKVQGKLKKQTGGHGQFANVWLEVGPLSRGAGFEFVDDIVGGVIPRQYIPSVKKGVQEALQKGLLGGFPVVDIRVTLNDGSYHDVDSSDYAFQVAGSLGLKSALEMADSVLLEPIASMRVVIPEDCAGSVMKDISRRRGHMLGLEAREGWHEIQAEIPLAEVLQYGQELGGMTSGRGTYTMHITAYREVPSAIVGKYLDQLEGSKQQLDYAAAG